MFDVGFWELAVIGLVALMVIGPERLPAVARTAGLWVGRLRRVAGSFREDLERELRTDDLKRSLVAERDALAAPIREVADELRSTVNDAAAEVSQVPTDAPQGDSTGAKTASAVTESRSAPPNE
ncbi:MAG: Sec-independent protein translocase protein TatB [Immundisolibacteraceae bacterium]|nr:Sec-independent protein translocase protein TatB [Immundisolibacteraceae bacterium]